MVAGIVDSSAMILSNKNPFELFSLIKKNSGKVSAKAGTKAPLDIEIPELDTGIPAGPALSDFKMLGLDTQIRGGKIYLAKPKVVVREGEKIKESVATVLNKLNIKPVEVSMSIMAVYDKTEQLLYLPEVLDVNVDQYRDMVKSAVMDTKALAIGIHYIAKETINALITKAFRGAKAVAVEGNIVNKETVKDLVVKASNVGNVLNKKVGE